MNNLSSVILLLQLVLQLLANPATANDPQTKNLVNTAITYATQALVAHNPTPMSTPTGNAPKNEVSIPLETTNSPKPIEEKHNCSLILRVETRYIINAVDYTYQEASRMPDGLKYPFPKTFYQFTSDIDDQSTTGYLQGLDKKIPGRNDQPIPLNYKDNSGSFDMSDKHPLSYEAHYGNAICYAYLPRVFPWGNASSTIVKSSPTSL